MIDVIVWLLIGLVGGVLGMLAVYRTFPSSAPQWIGSLVVAFAGAALILLALEAQPTS